MPLLVTATLPALLACRAVLDIHDAPLIDAGDAAQAADAEAVEAEAEARFCDQVTPLPSFCDDFDHGGAVVDRWDNHNRTPDIGASAGGVIEPELVRFNSGPRAVALSIPPLIDRTVTATAVLQATFRDPAPRDLTVEMELLVETEYFPPGSGVVDFLLLSYDGVPAIGILRRDSGTWVTIGKTDAARLSTSIVVGKWTTLTLIVQNKPVDGGSDGRVQVLVNQRRAADLPLPAEVQSAPHETMLVGPASQGPMGAFRIIVDNIRVWTRSDL